MVGRSTAVTCCVVCCTVAAAVAAATVAGQRRRLAEMEKEVQRQVALRNGEHVGRVKAEKVGGRAFVRVSLPDRVWYALPLQQR